MKIIRQIFGAAIILLASINAQSATIIQEEFVGIAGEFGFAGIPVSFNKFDTSLGILNQVTIDLHHDAFATGEVVTGSESVTQVTLFSHAVFNLDTGAGLVTYADDAVDYAWPIPGDIFPVNLHGHDFQTLSDPNHALYTGSGVLNGNLDVMLEIDSNAPDLFVFAEAFATARLTYDYTPSAVPVPAAVWLLGSSLLGLLGMARRKKA